VSRGRLTLERAAADHRAAIAAAVADFERVGGADWERPVRPGKWSPAEIAQHLTVSYSPAMSELAGGAGYRRRLSPLMTRMARWIALGGILSGRRFPSGGKSPPEARPVGPFPPPAEAAARLRSAAEAFEKTISEAHRSGGGRITNAYFGALSAPEALKVVAMHAEHHRKQLREPGGAA
jgi:hypothetical protein